MSVIPKGAEKQLPKRSIPVSYILAFFVFCLSVALIGIFLFGFYVGHWYQGPARTIAQIVPLPAASVEGDVIKYIEVVELAAVLDLAEETDILSTPFDRALEMLIDRRHLEHLAEELDVQIYQEDIDAYDLSTQEIQDFLTQVHWAEDDYRRYVVEPLLLSQALEEAVYDHREYQGVALAEIESIVENIGFGISFIDLAKQYSDDPTAVIGGDAGYFTLDELEPGLEPAFGLELEEVSDILETHDYFALAQPYDEIIEDEERVKVGLRLITIDKNDLDVALEEYKKGRTVKIYLK